MDNLTHTLTAIALGQTGLNRKTRFATLTLIVGANLPDLDIASAFWGSASYLEHHRGITHSLLGAAVLATLLGALAFLLGRRARPKDKAPRVNFRWLMLIAWIALASHVLLDFTNSYGLRPFLPFSGRWYAWDIEFIIDPLLLMLLAAGLLMPMVFRLVTEEVGAKKTGFRAGAIFSLVAMAAMWGLRDTTHSRVLGYINGHTYGQENPLRAGAFPSPMNPFAWVGVVETDSAFHVLPANALASDVDAEQTMIFHKPDPSPALEAAKRTRSVQVLLDFARFPWASVDQTEDGYDVTVQDLRFVSPSQPRRSFVAEVKLDRKLNVLKESFHLVGRTPR